MYCPKCKAEYREGFTYCKSCDAELVEGSPAIEEAQPVPSREKRGLIRSLSANIDKWLKVGGIVVVAAGVVQVIWNLIQATPITARGMELQPMLRVSEALNALVSLPSAFLAGFGYFALGEVISLLRKAGEQRG